MQTKQHDKIKFEGELTIPVILNGITKKLKVFVPKNSENLFGTDWMERFKLWDQPINNFCQKVENKTRGNVIKQKPLQVSSSK